LPIFHILSIVFVLLPHSMSGVLSAFILNFCQLADLRDIQSTALFPGSVLERFVLQIVPDFLLQFLEEFGIGLAHGGRFLRRGLPPMLPGDQAIPVILAKILK